MPMMITPVPAEKPNLETVPRMVDRPTGAKLVTLYYFPVTNRTLETWPLHWIIVGGKAICETVALFEVARGKLDAARPARPPRLPSGRAAARAPRTIADEAA
jgi:hypothetical protein